jgi:hypothetical protein
LDVQTSEADIKLAQVNAGLTYLSSYVGPPPPPMAFEPTGRSLFVTCYTYYEYYFLGGSELFPNTQKMKFIVLLQSKWAW